MLVDKQYISKIKQEQNQILKNYGNQQIRWIKIFDIKIYDFDPKYNDDRKCFLEIKLENFQTIMISNKSSQLSNNVQMELLIRNDDDEKDHKKLIISVKPMQKITLAQISKKYRKFIIPNKILLNLYSYSICIELFTQLKQQNAIAAIKDRYLIQKNKIQWHQNSIKNFFIGIYDSFMSQIF